MQKYRADRSRLESDGSVSWIAEWIGGPTLAKINNCRINGFDRRLTVYVTGEADTWFSLPAATRCKGRYVKGYITSDEQGYIFHAMDSHKERLL